MFRIVVFLCAVVSLTVASDASVFNDDGNIVISPAGSQSVIVNGDLYVNGSKVATENTVDSKISQNCDCGSAVGGTTVFGDLTIREAGMRLLSALSISKFAVIGSLYIQEPGNDLSAMNSLTAVGWDFHLTGVPGSLNGTFGNLTSVGGTVQVSQTGLQDLNGLRSLRTVGRLDLNGNTVLGDLNGLSGIQNITEGYLRIMTTPNAFICSSLLTRLKSFASSPAVLDVREDPC